MLPVQVDQPLAGNRSSAAEREVQQREDFPAGQLHDPRLELTQLPGRVDSSHQRPDGGAADDLGLDATLGERGENPDMRPATGRSASQGDADDGCGSGGSHDEPTLVDEGRQYGGGRNSSTVTFEAPQAGTQSPLARSVTRSRSPSSAPARRRSCP